MSSSDVKTTSETSFIEIREILLRMEHVLGNIGNVMNLYLAQEESLKNNIEWLLLRAIAVMEDEEQVPTLPKLAKVLLRLNHLRDMVIKHLGEEKTSGNE